MLTLVLLNPVMNSLEKTGQKGIGFKTKAERVKDAKAKVEQLEQNTPDPALIPLASHLQRIATAKAYLKQVRQR